MAQPKIARTLADLGFDQEKDAGPRRIIASSEGLNKTGKTNLLLTAPGPIGVFNVDIGLEGVVGKHVSKDHRIFSRNFALPADTVDLDESELSDEAEKQWTAFSMAFQAVCKLPKKECATIGWDTGTETWELCRLARFGKLSQIMPHQYTAVNSEFRKLLRCITDTDKNFIITHKLKKEYVDVVNQQGKKVQVPSGELIRAGFADIGYVVQVNLRHTRDENGFHMEIMDCRHDGELAGFTFDGKDCTFAKLATTIFPDTNEGDWK